MNPEPRGIHDREIFVEQVRALYNNASRSIPFNVINPAVLLVAFWPVAERTALVFWFVAMTGVSAVRMVHVLYVLRRESISGAPEAACSQFVIGATATALLWSTGFVSIGFDLPLVYLVLFLLVLGGMSAGAFTSMGTHRPAYLLFLACLYIPVLAKLAITGMPLATTISVFVLLFIVMLVLTHEVTYRILLDRIRGRIENERLAKQLERANRRLELVNSELETRAETDALTGVGNRGYFEQRLTLEWQRARRERKPLACLMVDVDYFKPFNDHYGHPAGDDSLTRIAAALKENVNRATDVVARYGGEEFIVLLPDTSLEGARSIGRRLNEAVWNLAIPHTAAPAFKRVTVSVGAAAMIPERVAGKRSLVDAADAAMYTAKSEGRNRVAVHESRAAMSNKPSS